MYKREMIFTCFPRFINLLVNDSTFLLDEALQVCTKQITNYVFT